MILQLKTKLLGNVGFISLPKVTLRVAGFSCINDKVAAKLVADSMKCRKHTTQLPFNFVLIMTDFDIKLITSTCAEY